MWVTCGSLPDLSPYFLALAEGAIARWRSCLSHLVFTLVLIYTHTFKLLIYLFVFRTYLTAGAPPCTLRQHKEHSALSLSPSKNTAPIADEMFNQHHPQGMLPATNQPTRTTCNLSPEHSIARGCVRNGENSPVLARHHVERIMLE